MKRALGVIVFAAFKTGNVAFPKCGKSVLISIRLGKCLKLGKLIKSIVSLLLGHIGCGRHTLTLLVNKLKNRMRIPSDFYFHAMHSCKNSAQVKHLKTKGSYA